MLTVPGRTSVPPQGNLGLAMAAGVLVQLVSTRLERRHDAVERYGLNMIQECLEKV